MKTPSIIRHLTVILAGALALAGCTSNPVQDSTQPGKATTPVKASFKQGVNISHYLSQFGDRPYAEPGFITGEDLSWIAGRGYDHVRLPVDGPALIEADGTILWERLAAVDRAIGWAHQNNLGVVLDIHELRGSNFSGQLDNSLFTDERLQADAVRLWRALAERYREIGPELRFEILNEPVADDSAQVTAFYAKVLATIRSVSPERVVVLCPNRWGRIETAEALEPLLGDPFVVVAIHYYDPHVFTHQQASWVGLDAPGVPPIPFPGTVPDLKPFLPESHYCHNLGGTELTVESIAADFRKVTEWARRVGVELYFGEFGAYDRIEPASRERWYRAMMDLYREHDLAWAVWDYKGGFAVRDRETGDPTAVQEILDDYLD